MEAVANKRSFDFKRTDHFLCDPVEDLCIVGGLVLPVDQRGALDTEEDESHALHDPRLHLPLAEAFCKNIDAFGVQQPITIVKLNDVACVVDGRQRVRAARVVSGWRASRGEPGPKVPCVIKRVKDGTSLLASMVSLNEARTDDDTYSKLGKLRRMLDRGVTNEDAAIAFSVDERTIELWLAFDDHAIDAVKQAVETRKLSFSAGAEIAKLKEPDKQQAALSTVLAGAALPGGNGKITARKVKAAARKLNGSSSTGGITSRKTLAKFLSAIEETKHPNASDRTLAWWDGVEAAIVAILGTDEGRVDERLTKIISGLEG